MNFKLPFHADKFNSKEKGSAHYIVPLIIISLVALVGTYMLVASHAATAGPHRYSKRTLNTFRFAASEYWAKPQRVDQGERVNQREAGGKRQYYYHIYDPSSSQVTCKPGDVKVRQINDDNSKVDGIAWVNVSPWILQTDNEYHAYPGAVQAPVELAKRARDKRVAERWNSPKGGYCKMVFNLARQDQISKPGEACTTFLHEYGHMLGRRHNNNVESPMYTGYNNDTSHDIPGLVDTFDLNHQLTLSKSLCRERFGIGS